MCITKELELIYAGLWHEHQFRPTSPKRTFLRDLPRLNSEDDLLSFFSLSELRGARESFLQLLGNRFCFFTKFSESYPSLLSKIPDPPPALYYAGTLRYSISVGVVGSRNPSRYGSEVTTNVARDLAQLGITVVSGLARGIDSAAHEAALKYWTHSSINAPTIAVLGSGLNHIYPHENKKLAERIVDLGGCLLSELPINTAPRPPYFPLRNRIISGLSEASVIVEARERSGSLITARTAIEQGRDVLVVPGKIDSDSFRGSNGLLRDGARPFLDMTDLFACLSTNKLAGEFIIQKKQDIAKLAVSVTTEESAVLSALEESEELTVEQIIHATKLPISTVASAVTSLTIRKLLQERPGQRYAREV